MVRSLLSYRTASNRPKQVLHLTGLTCLWCSLLSYQILQFEVGGITPTDLHDMINNHLRSTQEKLSEQVIDNRVSGFLINLWPRSWSQRDLHPHLYRQMINDRRSVQIQLKNHLSKFVIVGNAPKSVQVTHKSSAQMKQLSSLASYSRMNGWKWGSSNVGPCIHR